MNIIGRAVSGCLRIGGALALCVLAPLDLLGQGVSALQTECNSDYYCLHSVELERNAVVELVRNFAVERADKSVPSAPTYDVLVVGYIKLDGLECANFTSPFSVVTTDIGKNLSYVEMRDPDPYHYAYFYKDKKFLPDPPRDVELFGASACGPCRIMYQIERVILSSKSFPADIVDAAQAVLDAAAEQAAESLGKGKGGAVTKKSAEGLLKKLIDLAADYVKNNTRTTHDWMPLNPQGILRAPTLVRWPAYEDQAGMPATNSWPGGDALNLKNFRLDPGWEGTKKRCRELSELTPVNPNPGVEKKPAVNMEKMSPKTGN